MNQRTVPMLSKSRFLAGLQCLLRLWHQCYNRELASEITPAQQALFDMGHEVGRLATRRYPDGILIGEDHLHHEEAVRSTLTAMNDPTVPAIYEAAFLFDGVRIRVDILERVGDGRWNLIEVKSATTVKDEHYPDVCIQYYVLQGSGLSISRAGILHVNNQYVYDGRQLDLNSLFSFSDLTEQVTALQETIPERVVELKEMMAYRVPPEIRPTRVCKSPYQCEFWEHCTAHMPDFWIMNLAGITQKKFEQLLAMDIEDIRDIPDSFSLSTLQSRIKACLINQEEYIAPELLDELTTVEYTIHFLDFETVGPAIPRYAGTRPYQTIPFQWSDHVLYEDGTLKHHEYLCDEDKDPREEFAETLLEALGERGTIFVYSGYEKRIIKELVEHMPHYRDRIRATIDRYRDLHGLIKRHYYHPGFYGSFSLKSVLPVLVPSMRYEDLIIQEGGQASQEYLRMLDPATPPTEREKIRKDLLTYCGHDTMAMVKIREELLSRL